MGIKGSGLGVWGSCNFLQEGRIGPAAAPAVEPLAGLLDSPDAQVRREAMFALAKIGPAEVQSETVIGQYRDGAVNGEIVRGYVDELKPETIAECRKVMERFGFGADA